MKRRRDRRAHHAADPKRSDRLRRLLAVIRARPGISSLNLIKAAGVAGLSAAVDELRKRGHRIDCWRAGGLFCYRLEGRS